MVSFFEIQCISICRPMSSFVRLMQHTAKPRSSLFCLTLYLYCGPALSQGCHEAVGIGIPMVMGIGGYGDCNESPRVCGDSVGDF